MKKAIAILMVIFLLGCTTSKKPKTWEIKISPDNIFLSGTTKPPKKIF